MKVVCKFNRLMDIEDTKLLPTKVGRFWVGPTKSRLRV